MKNGTKLLRGKQVAQTTILRKTQAKVPLLRMKAVAGDAFKNNLRFNEVWKQFKT